MIPSARPRWLALLLTAACGGTQPDLRLPAPISDPVTQGGNRLLAGIGRADITPPPGVGLGGYSIENQQAGGYRHRLYARALVLDDGRGERMALVAVDLPHVSPVLHRLAAERVLRAGTGIGADRLLISATHTHAGPGNHYEAKVYNDEGSGVPGYDPMLVEFLVSGISRAVLAAVADTAPARAAWGAKPIRELTVNRSLPAFLLNPVPWLTPVDPSPGNRPEFQALDPLMTMLRVDRCPAGENACRPLGAFTVFAIHGTGYPAANELLDGDVHALIERGLERHIDDTNRVARECQQADSTRLRRCDFRPQAVHLVVNGTEGDVSPVRLTGPGDTAAKQTRCEVYLRFRVGRRPGGPRTPPAPEQWRTPRDSLAQCLENARRATTFVGQQLAAKAIELFTSLGGRVSPALPIARAFTTLHLPGLSGSYPLCEVPLTGTANFAGGADGTTRLAGWRILWFIPSRIEQGGAAINRKRKGCHGAKTVGLGPLQKPFIGAFGLPRYAQASVVRIGNRLIGTLPAEVTTEAGMRMKGAMLEAAGQPGDTAVVVGLTNGFIQYIPTAEEYEAQRYEGGSAIYGPNSAAALTEQLRGLAASLRSHAPTVLVLPIEAKPGDRRSHFPRATDGPDPTEVQRGWSARRCSATLLVARWTDVHPGRIAPAAGQLLEIQWRDSASATWRHAAWDDQAEVEVRALGATGDGYLWEVRWHRDNPSQGQARVVLAARTSSGLAELEGPAIDC